MKITELIHSFPWTSMEANNSNTYFIDGPKRILVDPGLILYFDRVKNELAGLGVGLSDIDYIALTHIHPDHFEAARCFREYDTRILYHKKEWELLKTMGPWIKEHTGVTLNELEPHQFLAEGPFPDPDVRLDIIHTPGHSPGSISLFNPEDSVLITGDAVFKDGVGRTDLPGGHGDHLKKSITRLSETGASAMLPGHGEVIVGQEGVKANFERIKSYWFSFV
ncbi:MBL fold metallo-hydrolase [Desulfoluna limicola]|uniref:MBL fold metallo-hydrolase n=1 Tax=Desulfoluna limicola TaxID=2810562 RepID=A0ABM7PIJ7_9BACT|nr:MBL fold metallo-hydrolase [Desulfoluna limicola]BCS96889.1 MBL fold metallo-hydrolase [Desulfoluna limicola]